MKVRVHTLMWGDAWKRYGRNFAQSFYRYWPESISLTIYTDAPIRELPDTRQRLLSECRHIVAFAERYAGNPKAEGRESGDCKAAPGKRFWKHDAVKWAPQAMVPFYELQDLDRGDILIWLDADVETIASIDEGWPEAILAGKHVAAVWRGRQHPDIGFWAIRNTMDTASAVRAMHDYYDGGGIFALPEWHSAYAWQIAMNAIPEAQRNNLNPEGLTGHPWPRTILAKHLVHHKGKLKDRIR